MQEAKNKRRFFVLVGLVILTLLVFWWLQPESRMAVNADIFQVEDWRGISKIGLLSHSDTVTLMFNGRQWEVNGNAADGNMINVLFATLQQARPRREVSPARRDSIYEQLRGSGVEVRLYSGNELKKKFIAGGNAAKTRAYFADPASGETYVMAIPGYRVYVSGIFELEESGWWDKLVFPFNWANFRRLEAVFPQDPSASFTVLMDRDHFAVEGLAATDTAKLHNYLDEVSLLTVDQYVSEPGLKDSLAAVQPFLHITVADVADQTYGLKLYKRKGTTPVTGVIQDAKVAVFDRRKIQSLLKPKSYFTKK